MDFYFYLEKHWAAQTGAARSFLLALRYKNCTKNSSYCYGSYVPVVFAGEISRKKIFINAVYFLLHNNNYTYHPGTDVQNSLLIETTVYAVYILFDSIPVC